MGQSGVRCPYKFSHTWIQCSLQFRRRKFQCDKQVDHLCITKVLHIESVVDLKELKIEGPLPNLKRLTIRDCLNMYSLEVYAINLLSFVYRARREIKVTFKVYPRLVEANIPARVLLNVKAYHLSRFFSRMESLVLDLRDWSMLSTLLNFPKLLKLRRLELYLSGDIFEVFLYSCAKLLKACPSLHRFVLEIYNLQCSYSLNKVREWRSSKHEQVKIMELAGFDGEELDVKLVHKLLDMLPSLENLCVDPGLICDYRCCSKDWDYEHSVAAAQHLHYSLPPTAHLAVGSRYRNYKNCNN